MRKTVTVKSITEPLEVILNENDQQSPKKWKALFVGVNKVSAATGSCACEYTTEQLDQAYDFFKWSFEENVEPFSYNTINWEIPQARYR